MAQPAIKTSFASGEWAPKLQGRVDIQKYHAGAALMQNFFVDYSGGGASTRQGTRFINTVLNSGARLIPFQPSSTLSFVLEFGQNYIRFYSNGAVIIDPNTAQPLIVTTPYAETDLFPNPLTGNSGLKFVQDVTSLIITHPNYPPMILTENSATSWSLSLISFVPTIGTPTGVIVGTTSGAGTFNYGYLVTAVDASGQESLPSAIVIQANILNIQTSPVTNAVSWIAVPGAVSYNVYACSPTTGSPISTGAAFGFVGNVTGTRFTEATPGIARDFSQGPPIGPSQGAGVNSLTLTNNGGYLTVPSITIAAPPSGIQADGKVFLGLSSVGPNGLQVSSVDPLNQPVNPTGTTITLPNGGACTITSAGAAGGNLWNVATLAVTSIGSIGGVGTAAPANFVPSNANITSPPGTGYVVQYTGGSINMSWHVGSLVVTQHGSGYVTAPAVAFSGGSGSAIAVIGPTIGGVSINPLASGNPSVCGFFQQRLTLAGPPGAVQTYYMSQPGQFYNFTISNPSQANDAINGTIISEDLNDIRSLVSAPTGLIALTGKGAWLINGGGGLSVNTPITPADETASPQAFNGANDLRPIKIGYNILYGTNKGNYVRDMNYNVYAGIYTGTDISVLSNHLFFGHYFLDWAWSEEPFKVLWAVREDGIMLSLSYVKEQELIGWAQHDTNGRFTSVCSVIENVNGNIVDAVYAIVRRNVNNAVHQFVERFADRFFTYGAEDAWSVDCALQTAPMYTSVVTNDTAGDSPLSFGINDGTVVGNLLNVSDTVNSPFTPQMAAQGWVIRFAGGIYQITVYTSSSQVTVKVLQVAPVIDSYNKVVVRPPLPYTIWKPVTVVGGLTHLIGMSVTGVADWVVVPPQVVSGGGTITLAQPATKVTLGLAFLPQLKTLPLDLGEPTIQSKRKKLPAVTLRVADTLGLQAGTSFANALNFKDFILGNIGSVSDQLVTGLVNGDGRMIIDQFWQEPGQICMQQVLPYPATILAVIPEVLVGDTK